MTIVNEIEVLDLDSRGQLIQHWEGIASLFEESFSQKLSYDLWEWAYIKNPYGEPKVSIAKCGNKIVGHYAVVPIGLKNADGPLSGFLSMTTMVSEKYRRLRLFKKLADLVYDRIELLGTPSVVVGFPNDNSAPGFSKRLDWVISEEYAVVKVYPNQIQEVKGILSSSLASNGFKMDLSDKKFRDWRLNKPSQEWIVENGLGIKKTSFGQDLMFIENIQGLDGAIGKEGMNMILPLASQKDYEVSFAYRFGYRAFNCIETPKFIVEMCMSDVF